MGAITEQGIFGVICAVLGVVAGIYLSRMIRRRRDDDAKRKRSATPTYASRQEMRKAERQQAKRDGR